MSRAVKMLLDKGWITREQYEQAMLLSTRFGDPPGFHLVEEGAIDDEDLADFFIRHFPLRFWPKYKLKSIPIETISVITSELAKHLRILPVELNDKTLTLALTDPSLTHVVDEVTYHTHRYTVPVLIAETDMTWALSYYYGIHPVATADRYSPPTSPAQIAEPLRGVAASEDGHNTDIESPIPPETDSSPPKKVVEITVTENGWGMDAWDPAPPETVETHPEDDAVPLSVPREAIDREMLRPPVASVPFVSMPPESKPTLPPDPAMRPSTRPSIRHSLASMMQGIKNEEPPISPPEEPETVKQSTDDIRVPKEIMDVYRNRVEIPQKTIAEIIGAIKSATDRNAIINHALDYLLLFADRAVFMTVKKDEIRGFDIKGNQTNRAAIKSYWIPVTSESTFGRTVEDRQIHLGPLGRSNTDAVFSAALGGRPRRVLVIPVTIRDRVVGLLYADKLKIEMPAWNLLERLAEVVGGALLGLLVNRIRH